MKTKFYLIFVSALVLGMLVGCNQADDALVVATDAAFPPFEFVDETTKDIVGFDIDLLNAIAETAELDIRLQNVAWDPLLAGMADCQYDMAISAITILPERAEQFSFSDPYINAGQIIAVAVDNDYPTAVAFVNKNTDQLKVVGEVFTDENYGIAFCKGNDALISQVNTALAELQADGFIDELVIKWYGDAD